MLQIHKASAGSGKTHTLTREYIKFLIAEKSKTDRRYRLRPIPRDNKPQRACKGAHSHILAITFTNKATNEMTRRIIKELACLAAMPSEDEKAEMKRKKIDVDDPVAITLSSPYARDFLDEETGLDCTVEELQEASRYALTTLLYDYSFFNVSTIDSFFQSVLRMFAREVDLPDNYNVELDNEYAINLGVDTLFQTINSYTIPDTPEDVRRKWISQWFYEYMRDKVIEGGSFNVFSPQSHLFSDLVKNIQKITGEDFKQRLGVLQGFIGDTGRIIAFKNAIEDVIKSAKESFILKASQLLESYDKEMFHHFFFGNLKTLQSGKLLNSPTTMKNVANNPNKATVDAVRKKGILDDKFFSMSYELASEYSKFEEKMVELRPLYKQIYVFGLISNVMGNIQEYCRENSLILLNETNNILKGLINDDETPFIYEKLGFYLDHFLIDEFQDTSPMQWENLKPLLMESLSRDNDDLVIGDEKQCIYRFRNSDPRLLSSGVQEDAVKRFHSPDIIGLKGHEIKDNSNWRSAPEIIRFNNTLFTAVSRIIDAENDCKGDILSATKTYANVIQQIDPRRKADPGYVKVIPNSKSVYSAMVQEIKRELNSGYKAGKIAILVDRHAIGQDVISCLLDAMNDPEVGLPRFDIVSDDSMELGSSRAIRLIVGILRLVNMPEFLDADAKAVAHATGTDESLATESEGYRRAKLINRYQFYLHRQHLDGTPFTASEALEAAIIDNRTPDEDFDAFKNKDVRDLIDMPCIEITTLVDRLIHDYVPPKLKETENLFITSLMDKVVELGAMGRHGINDFIKWWDKIGYKVRLSVPANENAITVMTIHKAKGLEFPCVHIPFMTKNMPSSTAWIDLDAEKFAPLGIDPALVPAAMPIVVDKGACESKIYGAQCRDNMAQSMVDKLNNIYVAFTRATRELIVYSPQGDSFFKNLILDGIVTADKNFLDNLGFDNDVREWLVPLADKYNDSVFEYGTPTQLISAEKSPANDDETIHTYMTTGNMEHIKARTEPDAKGAFNIEENRYFGIFCHEVMSRVRRRGDLPLALRRTAYHYHVTPEDTERVGAMLQRTLDNPVAARWFDGKARIVNERPVTIGAEERRPDRVILLPDGTVEVVDYKFVESFPSDHDHSKYVRQVRRYCRAVKDYATRGWVQGYLWYIFPDKDAIIKI